MLKVVSFFGAFVTAVIFVFVVKDMVEGGYGVLGGGIVLVLFFAFFIMWKVGSVGLKSMKNKKGSVLLGAAKVAKNRPGGRE
ncbi:hypothetical protein [Solilutibacter pythonis]|uniref:hypothetical protein n=1 Tax=Solilutibacter pythonis TaxID=2483112 RepID=UPI000EFA3C02|nr:hypothetical protein [Lysobacter pythonis]